MRIGYAHEAEADISAGGDERVLGGGVGLGHPEKGRTTRKLCRGRARRPLSFAENPCFAGPDRRLSSISPSARSLRGSLELLARKVRSLPELQPR